MNERLVPAATMWDAKKCFTGCGLRFPWGNPADSATDWIAPTSEWRRYETRLCGYGIWFGAQTFPPLGSSQEQRDQDNILRECVEADRYNILYHSSWVLSN
jgi:hypothetical protein